MGYEENFNLKPAPVEENTLSIPGKWTEVQDIPLWQTG